MENIGKYTAFDHTPASTHNLLLGLIPPRSRVLEFGCATGYMSREMVKRLHCETTGVELEANAAELAKAYCRQVFVGDATAMDFNTLLRGETFDVILFADVLEHLRYPESLLRKVKPLLSENGAVVCSVPNIAHGSVRLSLLGGEFNYSNRGLLDDTHIRFFTLKTLTAMFEQAGYHIGKLLRRRVPAVGGEVAIPHLPGEMIQWVENQPEASTYQFVLRAAPAEKRQIEEKRTDYTAATKEMDAPDAWETAVKESVTEVNRHVPGGGHFLLLDETHWMGFDDFEGRKPHRFPEKEGCYFGPPANDAQALAELNNQEEQGNAGEIVIAWPAFWWLDHYAGFAKSLETRYRVIWENERIRIYRRK